MKLTIIYDNKANPGFKSGWGFSCIIETTKKILFDTGCEGSDLLFNMRKLRFNPKEIDAVVISHQHLDHIGGLFSILSINENIKVFVLSSFSENVKNHIRKKAEIKEIKQEQRIYKNVFTTGLIKNNPDEQSLIVKTRKGIVVIVGCSHPGVDKILEIARKYGKIYAIIGGFHGFSDFDVLKDISIIGACHCTQYMQEIKERFPKQFREIRAGDIIEC